MVVTKLLLIKFAPNYGSMPKFSEHRARVSGDDYDQLSLVRWNYTNPAIIGYFPVCLT